MHNRKFQYDTIFDPIVFVFFFTFHFEVCNFQWLERIENHLKHKTKFNDKVQNRICCAKIETITALNKTKQNTEEKKWKITSRIEERKK